MIHPAKRQPDYTKPGHDVPQWILTEYEKNLRHEQAAGNMVAGLISATCFAFILAILVTLVVAMFPHLQARVDQWRADHTVKIDFCPWPR